MANMHINNLESSGYNLEHTLQTITQQNFSGNIIPHILYTRLTFESGKPDFISIIILSDVLYWYRLTEIRDEQSGHVMGYKKKFKADKLQRTVADWAKQFGFTRRQVSDALKRLADKGLVTKELRSLETAYGQTLNNVMYIAPVAEAVQALLMPAPIIEEEPASSPSLGHDDDYFIPLSSFKQQRPQNTLPDCGTSQRTPFDVSTYPLVRSSVGGGTLKRSTYTNNTTEITTQTAAEKSGALTVLPKQIFISPENKSAAAVCMNQEKQNRGTIQPAAVPNARDELIGTQLTIQQQKLIVDKIKQLTRQLNNGFDEHQLKAGIEFNVLDPQSFTAAGKDFYKKLNTITKAIRSGSWQMPAGLLADQQKVQQNEKHLIRQQLVQLHSEVAHWQKMQQMLEEQVQPSSLQLQQNAHWLAQSQQALADFLQRHTPTLSSTEKKAKKALCDVDPIDNRPAVSTSEISQVQAQCDQYHINQTSSYLKLS